MYLLDTCVISELTKPRPSPVVVKWLENQSPRSFYLSVITIAELQRGISKLKQSKKKSRLEEWLLTELPEQFENKILEVDTSVAHTWGRACAKVERRGQAIPTLDGLIAATAIANDLALVTRDEKHVKGSGVEVINPWVNQI